MFKVLLEVPKSLLILFCILLSSFFSGWMFILIFYSKKFIWVLVSFLSLLAPYMFSFISLCIAFISSFILWENSAISVSILITSVLHCASDSLCISLSLSSFSGGLICSFIWTLFLCLSIPVCMNVSSLTPWLLDFHAVWFSGSSGCCVFFFIGCYPSFGCARKQSISTYASILARTLIKYF